MIEINLSNRFKRSYKKLPSHLKDDFDEKISIFINNPTHQTLKSHKLKGKLQSCLAFCLKDGFRVLFEFQNHRTVNLLDIGPHDKYKKWPK